MKWAEFGNATLDGHQKDVSVRFMFVLFKELPLDAGTSQ